MHKFKCPHCGDDSYICRNETVYLQTPVKPTDTSWTYDEDRMAFDGAILWDTCGRYDLDDQEFKCVNCLTDFDWSIIDGPTNVVLPD